MPEIEKAADLDWTSPEVPHKGQPKALPRPCQAGNIGWTSV